MAKKDKGKKGKMVDLLLSAPILKPISLEDIGSNGDPCFGKSYDLSTKECKMCGDSELCAMVFAQNMNTTREGLEKEKHFKDMDVLIDIAGAKKFMRKLKRDGYIKKDILDKSMERFSMTRQESRDIYKSLTNKEK